MEFIRFAIKKKLIWNVASVDSMFGRPLGERGESRQANYFPRRATNVSCNNASFSTLVWFRIYSFFAITNRNYCLCNDLPLLSYIYLSVLSMIWWNLFFLTHYIIINPIHRCYKNHNVFFLGKIVRLLWNLFALIFLLLQI